jgi:hypothetical protein
MDLASDTIAPTAVLPSTATSAETPQAALPALSRSKLSTADKHRDSLAHVDQRRPETRLGVSHSLQVCVHEQAVKGDLGARETACLVGTQA